MSGTRSTSPLRPISPIPTWSRGLVQRAGAATQTVARFVPLVTRPTCEILARSVRRGAAALWVADLESELAAAGGTRIH